MARTPATEFFGAELRRAREAAEVSREEFGKLTNYAPSTIGAFETGERFPNARVAAAADDRFHTDKFAALYELLLRTGDVYKEGFQPWRDAESQASCIWTYELALVPGLLQTEGYARALLGEDDAEVDARLDRQSVLTRVEPPPPSLVALVAEQALTTLVGDEGVMRKQLDHLTVTAQHHVVQVVPHGTRTYLHLDGAFSIAAVEGRDIAFVETPVRGFVVEDPQVVLDMRRRWDAIRAQAMSASQSIDHIQKVAEQWT